MPLNTTESMKPKDDDKSKDEVQEGLRQGEKARKRAEQEQQAREQDERNAQENVDAQVQEKSTEDPRLKYPRDPNDITPDPRVDQTTKLNTVLDDYRNMVREWLNVRRIHVSGADMDEWSKLHDAFIKDGYKPEMTRNVKTRDDDPKMETPAELEQRFDKRFDAAHDEAYKRE